MKYMDKLLKLYREIQTKKQSLQLTLDHDKFDDWTLLIYHGDSKTIVFDGQHADIDFLSSQAYVALYNWFYFTLVK